ncbi:MAG: hypothetical protein MRECE_35c004 [Mycoplasmataceae bacterium CE_OT135]|nr:MAG: hypothetical protein MRECE_35c004 [Mycoplasmataceae bacterium CE_OT135]
MLKILFSQFFAIFTSKFIIYEPKTSKEQWDKEN